jgi:hypothetical protein
MGKQPTHAYYKPYIESAALATRVVLDTGSLTSRWAHIRYSRIPGMVAVAAFAYNIIRTVRARAEEPRSGHAGVGLASGLEPPPHQTWIRASAVRSER